MNYAQLTQMVQDYLQTDETTFVANIPNFFKSVENRVYNEVALPALRKSSASSLAAGDRFLSVPTDFISAYSVALIDQTSGNFNYLMLKDVNLIREVYPSPTQTGTPKYYGVHSPTVLLVGPTPAKTYNVELHYFYYPESIVTAGTSWVGDNYHTVLLYGVIAEGYRFLKGDPALQKTYDDQYMNALSLLGKQGEERPKTDAYNK